jgi:hypothetical protein
MRILIDLPENQIQALATICSDKHVPRAELIRQAIGCFITKHKSDGIDAFGLWGNKKVDGLDYQNELRSEW